MIYVHIEFVIELKKEKTKLFGCDNITFFLCGIKILFDCKLYIFIIPSDLFIHIDLVSTYQKYFLRLHE